MFKVQTSIIQVAAFFLAMNFVIPFAWAKWDLNDVTILYPLPNSAIETLDDMLGFVDQKTGSIFLDVNLLFNNFFSWKENGDAPFTYSAGGFPKLNKDSEFIFNSFRVVGVRFDPCFRDVFEDKCRRQIRFTWQPENGTWFKVFANERRRGTFFQKIEIEYYWIKLEETSPPK